MEHGLIAGENSRWPGRPFAVRRLRWLRRAWRHMQEDGMTTEAVANQQQEICEIAVAIAPSWGLTTGDEEGP